MNVGDVYYAAEATINGIPHDIGEYGFPCDTYEEAKENAEIWLSWLSEFERKFATTTIRKWKVMMVDECGYSAETVD